MTRPSPAVALAPRARVVPPALAVAQACAERIAAGGAMSAAALSRLMTKAHGGSDAGGAWSWRIACDALEPAQVLAFRRASAGSLRGDPASLLAVARAIAARCPAQSRRSEAQLRLQQFSTPLPLAVVVATPYASLYDDDGAITPQVRLIRPRWREVMTRAAFAESAWKPCAPGKFAALWDTAVAALPEAESEELMLVSGLILPVWKHLPRDAPMIRRLTTDCGQPLIGRIVGLDQLHALSGALKPLDPDSPASVARAVMTGNRPVALMHSVSLRRRLVGGRQRCEIEGVLALPPAVAPTLTT